MLYWKPDDSRLFAACKLIAERVDEPLVESLRKAPNAGRGLLAERGVCAGLETEVGDGRKVGLPANRSLFARDETEPLLSAVSPGSVLLRVVAKLAQTETINEAPSPTDPFLRANGETGSSNLVS